MESISRMFRTERVMLPDTLEEIGSGAFSSCESLNELRIPESIKSIEEDAFEGTPVSLKVPIVLKDSGICWEDIGCRVAFE